MKLLSRISVDLAYALQGSARYRKQKRFFYNLLENGDYPLKRYFDLFMVLLIFASVVILVREVKSPLDDFWHYFNDYIISLIFLVEYVLRLWVYSDTSKSIISQFEKDTFLNRPFRLHVAVREIIAIKLNYVWSFQAVIDLLAIMPFFHELRLLRLFILFRVFKLFRYAQSLKYFVTILSTKKFELTTLFIFISVIMAISAVLIYAMEANNPASQINTLFDAFYWAMVTISTVGYGDFVPVSDGGRTVALFIILAGIAVISFSTSIIVSAFTERLDEIKEEKTVSGIRTRKGIYLLCGYGELSQLVAVKLLRGGENLIVLDADFERVKQARKAGITALHADPGKRQSYERMQIDLEKQVKMVLALGEDDVQNVFIALTVRAVSTRIRILSVLKNARNRKKFELAGINDIMYTQELIGLIAREVSGKPVAFEAIHLLRSETVGVFVDEVPVDARVAAHYSKVSQIDPSAYRLILIGIYDAELKKTRFHPGPDAAFSQGDILILMGERILINEFKLSLHLKKRA